jgi:pyruvate dehydrogenase E2 component (dihydrolipoamide acetyltransferase)
VATFDLPDLGEGLTEATVLRWLVAPGDTVTLNQPLVEVETAKAAVEVPSPFAGVVAALHHAEGEEALVGTPLITITTSDDADVPADTPERTPVLVGYGPRTGTVARRARKHAGTPSPTRTGAGAPPDRVGKQPWLEEPSGRREASPAPTAAPAPMPRAPESPVPLAKPLVRKLAKERGVDLRALTGTGPYGTVTRDDVEGAAAGSPAHSPAALDQLGVGVGVGAVAVTGVRKLMAEAMTRSAAVPTATLFLTVDVTPTTQLVQRLKPELEGVRVNLLLLTARALLLGLRRHPEANASWTDAGIVTHPRVNLGIAAATPRGLLVPHVKDAGSLALADLGRALGALVETAREGRTAPADMAGGTATITNIGTFGIDAGTPILNPGESVILALGTVRPTPWVVDGEIVVRDVCQLALAFDHRVLDGRQASMLLADVGRVLSDPDVAHAWT